CPLCLCGSLSSLSTTAAFMTVERWQQIELLYHAAMEREPSDRASFLNNACAGDESLRREVESLLSAGEQAGSFIESPAGDLAVGMFADKDRHSMIGRMLG